MRQTPEILQSVFRELPNLVARMDSERRIRVECRPMVLPSLLTLLKGQAGYVHLSAISCVDWPEFNDFELVYHLWSHSVKTLVSAHIFIPKKPGRFVSVHDIHTPAAFFERDIHEMFGVEFEGSPDQSAFILTEWYGPPPMLKSFNTEQYCHDTYQWQDYSPEWLREVLEKGGRVVE